MPHPSSLEGSTAQQARMIRARLRTTRLRKELPYIEARVLTRSNVLEIMQMFRLKINMRKIAPIRMFRVLKFEIENDKSERIQMTSLRPDVATLVLICFTLILMTCSAALANRSIDRQIMPVGRRTSYSP